MPEVESLALFLTERCVGRVIARIDLAAFSALKTYDPPLSALHGLEIDGHGRSRKWVSSITGLMVQSTRCGWYRS